MLQLRFNPGLSLQGDSVNHCAAHWVCQLHGHFQCSEYIRKLRPDAEIILCELLNMFIFTERVNECGGWAVTYTKLSLKNESTEALSDQTCFAGCYIVLKKLLCWTKTMNNQETSDGTASHGKTSSTAFGKTSEWRPHKCELRKPPAPTDKGDLEHTWFLNQYFLALP